MLRAKLSFGEFIEKVAIFFEKRKWDKTLNATLKRLSEQAKESSFVLPFDEDEKNLILRCLQEGARSHLKKGAIDDLLMMPDATTFLMSMGSKPTDAFIDNLNTFTKSWARTPSKHFKLMKEKADVLSNSVYVAIDRAPELKWDGFLENKDDTNSEHMFAVRISSLFPGTFSHLVRQRLKQNQPIIRPNQNPQIYKDLLLKTLHTFNAIPWPQEAIEQVIRGLVDLGLDPNAKAPINPTHQAPLIAHAMLRRPELVETLIDCGARVNNDVIKMMFFALLEPTINQSTSIGVNPDKYAQAFEVALKNNEDTLYWGMTIPLSNYPNKKVTISDLSKHYDPVKKVFADYRVYEIAKKEEKILDLNTAMPQRETKKKSLRL